MTKHVTRPLYYHVQPASLARLALVVTFELLMYL